MKESSAHMSSRKCVEGLVSVVVPAYNAAAYIAETLSSILAQSYQNIEVIVVNDGSTDNTGDLVGSEFKEVILLSQENSGGCSSPRNTGLRVASGEYVTFFDADDLMESNKISAQVEFLRNRPEANAVLTDYQNFDSNGLYSQTHFDTCTLLRKKLNAGGDGSKQVLFDAEEFRSILVEENFTSACSPMIRKPVLTNIGGFDEGLLASEDFDLHYRLAGLGKIGVMDIVGFRRRIHGSNMSHRVVHILNYKIASRKKALEGNASPEVSRRLRDALSSYHFSLSEYLALEDPSVSFRHVALARQYGHPANIALLKVIAKCFLGKMKKIFSVKGK